MGLAPAKSPSRPGLLALGSPLPGQARRSRGFDPAVPGSEAGEHELAGWPRFPRGPGWDALRRYLVGAPGPVLVWDEGGDVLLASDALLAATGFSPDQISTLAAWSTLTHGPVFGASPDRLAAAGRLDCGEAQVRASSGKSLSWQVSEVALGPGPNGLLVFATMAVDLTERQEEMRELRRRALRDRLTGLYTRRHLAEQVEAAIAVSERYGQPLSLCLCDLDGLSAINQKHGHEVGDDLLKRFATTLRESLRTADMPARAGGMPGRMGGDEFCVLFPFTPENGALEGLRRVAALYSAEEVALPGGDTFRATASFGVTGWRDGVDTASLFAAAASALKDAQEAGPGNIRVA